MQTVLPPGTTSEIVELVPRLRAYARTLTHDAVDADDLVQETLVRALTSVATYREGTRLRAWLFTIMRNAFYTNFMKRSREMTGKEDCVAGLVAVGPDHDTALLRGRLVEAIGTLPDRYREMLMLVVVLGESYESAAEITGVAMGTVKSRVNRARQMVMDALGHDALN